MITPKTAKLLSFVFMAAVLPLLALYGLMMSISMPGPDSGMEPTTATVAYVAFTVLFSALIIVCVNFSRQLAAHAKGVRVTP